MIAILNFFEIMKKTIMAECNSGRKEIRII